MFRRGTSFPFTRLAALAVCLTLGQGDAFSAPKKKRRAAAAPEVEVPAQPIVVAKARALRTEGPNILFILVDGLNDWTGWMAGHPQARTPNMDRLAKMGMSFTNAHTAYSGAEASRAALLTGMWPWKSGISSAELDWKHTAQMKEKETLPERLQLAGFMTAGAQVESDTAWDARAPQAKVTRNPAKSPEGLQGTELIWASVATKEEDTADGKATQWAIDYLQKQPADSPFFLAIGLSSPRPPWQVPAKYLEERSLADVKLPEAKADDVTDLPASAKEHLKDGGLQKQLTDKQLSTAVVRRYLASITFCDDMVGKVLDALERSPHKDGTVIILTSNQGRAFGEKQLWSEGGLWEKSTRVPLVIVAPKITQPGTQSAQPVSLVDLYPTLCDLTALPDKPAYLDGTSLLPLLKDPALKQDRPVFTVAGTAEKPAYGVRTERYRYIRYSDGAQELYDHQSDPMEVTNLLAPGTVAPADTAGPLTAWQAALPKEWASTRRPLNDVKLDAAADGSVTYWLQAGDIFPASTAPDIVGRGLDIEVVMDYRPEADANATIISQGNEKLGYAVHLIGGVPAFTVNYDGLRATLKGKEPLPSGKINLRALFGLDGTLAVGSTDSKEEIRGFAPMEGGFPRQPEGPLTVGRSVGTLPADLFPDSTVFKGKMERVALGLLPGMAVELRAAKAVPVE